MALQKQYNVKIFDQDGTTLLRTLQPDEFRKAPTFKTVINGGQGQLKLDLRGDTFLFDSFLEGTVVDFMNIVRVFEVDVDNILGRLIYTGYITRYEPYINVNGEEGVVITMLGLVSLLGRSFLGSSPAWTRSFSTTDPEDIAKDIIDRFNLVYGGTLINYAVGTTDPVGTNVDLDFTEKTWFQAVDKTKDVASADFWWSVRADGGFYFKDKPSVATHTLTIGKDIDSIVSPKDSEKVVNDIVVRWASGNVTASDAASQIEFGTGSPAMGKLSKVINDSELGSSGAGQQRANKEIADKKDARIKATIVLNTFFDLESINVGDTCKVRNFDGTNTFFNDNMQIASVAYSPDNVTLELIEQRESFGEELEGFIGEVS